jgi:hypothetical protein
MIKRPTIQTTEGIFLRLSIIVSFYLSVFDFDRRCMATPPLKTAADPLLSLLLELMLATLSWLGRSTERRR